MTRRSVVRAGLGLGAATIASPSLTATHPPSPSLQSILEAGKALETALHTYLTSLSHSIDSLPLRFAVQEKWWDLEAEWTKARWRP